MHSSIHSYQQFRPLLGGMEIPVDNSQFSTFSTGFSTGVIHRKWILWIFIFGSHKMSRWQLRNPYFFAGGVFYYEQNFVQKFGLDISGDRAESPGISFRKKVKKGVDFAAQKRYNVCLYGKLEEGGAIHAQH